MLSRLGPGPGDLIWDVGAGQRLRRHRVRPPRRSRHRRRTRPRELRPHPPQRRTSRRPRTAGRGWPREPCDLPDPDAVFVGGTGGGFEEIVKLCAVRARRAVVLALVTLERVVPAAEILEDCGLEVETTFLQASGMKGVGELHRLAAESRLRRLGEQAVIGLIAATANGRRNAAHLADAWPDARLYEGKAKEALRRAWNECDGIVLFLATGAAVRLIAPLLESKHRDPGVVTVDDAANFAVALCGGHEGGANALAARVADTLGATPVITTASDSVGFPALDSLGETLGFQLEEGSDLAAVGAALVSGEKVRLVSDRRWPLGPLPENVVRTEEWEAPLILISDRLEEVPRPAVVYRPPSLVAGVGCSRGVGADEILGLLRRSLEEAGLTEKSVAALASIDAKRDEAGLLEAAEELDVPLRFHPAEELLWSRRPTLRSR